MFTFSVIFIKLKDNDATEISTQFPHHRYYDHSCWSRGVTVITCNTTNFSGLKEMHSRNEISLCLVNYVRRTLMVHDWM